MDITDLIREEVAAAHHLRRFAISDIEAADEIVNWQPGGIANSLGQLIAHATRVEDMLINRFIKEDEPLLTEARREAMGIPAERTHIWQKDWRLDFDAFKEYLTEVEEASNAYLASITPESVARDVAWFWGDPKPIASRLMWILVTHTFGHCGEVSVLRGLKGLKGLPM